jgi:hypothetical protein
MYFDTDNLPSNIKLLLALSELNVACFTKYFERCERISSFFFAPICLVYVHTSMYSQFRFVLKYVTCKNLTFIDS